MGKIIDLQCEDIDNRKTADINCCKIIHAPSNIAGSMTDNVDFLKRNNIYARGFEKNIRTLKFKTDYTLPMEVFMNEQSEEKVYRKVFEKFLNEYDIFHFYFGRTFLNNHDDLKILCDNKKKVIMSFLGSDCRLPSEVTKYNPYYKNIVKDLKEVNEDNIKRNLETCSRYIKFAVAGPSNAYLSVSKYFDNTFINRLGLDLNYYSVSKKIENKIPIIVHAPTSRLLKGTNYIFKAIDNLKNKYKFNFIAVENMSNEEAKKIYEKADLIIDQLILGEYGRFAIECMSMGKPVICYFNDYFKELSGLEPPVINANPDTIQSVIECCLNNRDMLPEIALKGRKFVETYHDIEKNGKKLIEIYKCL